ncbi:Ribonuclease H-like domain [Pseudocohnilembus persalinus]|uniref:Ribonuclease H-like domain n=1 Tax=Pseudocohnilembus persalinus TaxID=266149 RepID=A0A0V0R502_PSEPJ|nr:Ribonuclease H-like domain [Pseudocohnilembus persalinus]|eukprot:KRX09565.1 Ribonuclease H-like domain [Pseudocohnilembus persalinus]
MEEEKYQQQNEQNNQQIDLVLGKENYLKLFIQSSALLVKSSNKIPTKDDVVMTKKSEQTKQKLNKVNGKFNDLMNRIAKLSNQNNSININQFGSVIEINDEYLENVDLALDKIRQQKKGENKLKIEQNIFTQPDIYNQQQQQKQDQQQQSQNKLLNLKKDKVQDIYFSECIDNTELPFVPKLNEKYNAKIPLDETIVTAQNEGVNFFKDVENIENYEFPHPYFNEITELDYLPEQTSNEMVPISEVEMLTNDNFLYVDNEEKLNQMMEDLEKQKEIGIDLEHHNYRTFQGITCLIQISSRNNDYVVDPFPLWQNLQVLNKVFTNPNIVKILHGADMDILWLQRDFGLYIVNMFDTGQAARQLNLPSFGLAYLLKYYCGVEADKKYQLADWRQRPLSKDLLYYARQDTHFLFKIYENLKNELIKVALVKSIDPYQQMISVLKKSGEVTLKKYQKPQLKDSAYEQILQRHRGIFNKNKLKVLEGLMEWRFEKARIYDESLRYILPNDVLFQIAAQLPGTLNELFMKFRNLNVIVKSNAQEIIDIICNSYGEKSKNQKMEEEEENKKKQELLYIPQIPFPSQAQNQAEFDHSFEKLNIQNLDIDINIQFNDEKGLLIKNIYEDGRQQKQEKLQAIKESFSYQEPLDLYCEFYPQLKQVYLQIQEQEQERVKQLEFEILNNQNKEKTEVQELNEPNRVEFIELPNMQEQQKKEPEELRFPKALGDQYDINIKRKRYKFAKNDQVQDTVVKKVKNNNQFMGLQEDEDDEEEEEQNEEQDKQIQQNIQKSNINQQQLQVDSDFDEESDDLDEQQLNNQINTSLKMNEIADKMKQKIDGKRNNFMHLGDPIDNLYRKNNMKGKKGKKGGKGNNQQQNNKKNNKFKNNKQKQRPGNF